MPFAPGNNNNSGQILAAGISDLAGQYAQDLLRAQEIEQKRRTAAGQIQGLLASNPQLGQKADPTLLAKMSSGKANYKDTLELLGTLNTVKQQEDEALSQKLKQAQMEQFMAHTAMLGQQNEQLKAQLEQDRANRDAMKKAAPYLAGETTSDFGARGGYVLNNPAPMVEKADPARALAVAAQSGADPRALGQLAESIKDYSPKAPKPMPTRLTLGGVSGIWDGNNFSRDPVPKGGDLETKIVNGRTYYRSGPNDEWKPQTQDRATDGLPSMSDVVALQFLQSNPDAMKKWNEFKAQAKAGPAAAGAGTGVPTLEEIQAELARRRQNAGN